tara:strand:- start:31219 stop:31446 length:228 start_codon:yes stop_codon:yes gene_type:complete
LHTGRQESPGQQEDGDAKQRNDKNLLEFLQLRARVVAGQQFQDRCKPAETQGLKPTACPVDRGENFFTARRGELG